MNDERVAVRPSSVSTEEARNVRARAWAFVLQCYEQHKAATDREAEEQAEACFEDELVGAQQSKRGSSLRHRGAPRTTMTGV